MQHDTNSMKRFLKTVCFACFCEHIFVLCVCESASFVLLYSTMVARVAFAIHHHDKQRETVVENKKSLYVFTEIFLVVLCVSESFHFLCYYTVQWLPSCDSLTSQIALLCCAWGGGG